MARDDGDPWDGPRSVMWAVVTVVCCAASILTRSEVPVMALAAGAGLWPAVIRLGGRR